MARIPRSTLPDGLFHANARGNRGQAIYVTDRDATSFLDELDLVAEAYQWRVFAYCLMPNHYHLVVRADQPQLSDGMRRLNGLHAQRFNRAHGQRGHVFQGRFHTKVIAHEAYLKNAVRYVLLNPVRAGLSSVEAWPWSSYRATAGLEKPRRCLDVDTLLLEFGDGRDFARRAFVRYVAEHTSHVDDAAFAAPLAGTVPGTVPDRVPDRVARAAAYPKP